ncbi:hypothetical protein N7520_011751 [Penicillium odoratum]|uniref:uncharacterized protein n=1 Tax=Penicillium odoratum TaxID=1167516 RepID=UPI0025465D7D|nr:uncharacterized protein N7520_011751 [Penicillium odoratum]KAJ5746569.1 hypothetical protein N7520_011751 [Penicillium odoratum]
MITLVAWTVFATVTFALTAWFSSTTFVLNTGYEIQSRFHVSFANTVIILRILQGVTSWATSSAVAVSFETAMWASTTSAAGSRILTLLTISPMTGVTGVLKLICSKATTGIARAWGSASMTLHSKSSSIDEILPVNTSATTSYYPINTFDVLAGTGPFNGSLIGPFLEEFNTTIPYFAIAGSYSFVNDPAFSISIEPSSCAGEMTPCNSYLFPGGIYLMWPQLNSSMPVDTVISIENAPAMRVDFAKGLSSNDNFFLAADCTTYGDGPVARLAASLFTVDAKALMMDLGIYVCGKGTLNGECLVALDSGSTSNVTTAFSISSYTASSINSVSNNTILSAFDLASQNTMYSIDARALSLAVGWLLNYTAANLPVESSLDFQFWETGSDEYLDIWEINAYTMLKSIIGFILWEFNANNNGNPAVSNTESNDQTPDLPAEFHTTASICLPFARFILDRTYFVAYIVLQSTALAFCWAMVLCGFVIHRQIPATTTFPVVDFGAKLRQMDRADGRLFLEVGREDSDKQITHALQRVRVTSHCMKKEDFRLLVKEERVNHPQIRRRSSWP